jgi:hypothetical protein
VAAGSGVLHDVSCSTASECVVVGRARTGEPPALGPTTLVREGDAWYVGAPPPVTAATALPILSCAPSGCLAAGLWTGAIPARLAGATFLW